MSRAFRMASLLALLLLASAASESVFARNGSRGGHSGGHSGAHHGGHRAAVGMMFAAPAFWLFRAPLYAPPVVSPSAPPVYIEQGDAQPAAVQAAGDWWYYCAESKTYYPYVKECAQEWQRVAAEPPVGR